MKKNRYGNAIRHIWIDYNIVNTSYTIYVLENQEFSYLFEKPIERYF